MKISNTFLNLAWINLKRTKIRTLLTSSTIIIGITSLFLILSLNAGIQNAVFSNAEKQNPLNQIIVQSPSSENIIGSLLGTIQNTQITNTELKKIQTIPHVTSVYPETSYSKPSSLEVSIFGQKLQTDAMVFGVPYEFIQDEVPNSKEWNNPQTPYPALISKKLLDLYNLSVANTQGLPQITPDLLANKEIDIYLGYSSFFAPFEEKENAQKIKAKIIGFSDKTNLIGITLPLELVKELNKKREPNYQDKYVNLYVQADNPQEVEKIAKTIETDLKLQTRYLQKTYSEIKDNFTYLTLGLTLISIIILFVSALSIANSFFSNIHERINEIGILRAIGAPKKSIKKLFLSEAAILGLISGILGIIIGLILMPPINSFVMNLLPEISSKPTFIFQVQPLQLILIPLFSLLLSILSAYIPATTASRMNTIQALNTNQ